MRPRRHSGSKRLMVHQLGPSRIWISPRPEERIEATGDVVWTDTSKKTRPRKQSPLECKPKRSQLKLKKKFRAILLCRLMPRSRSIRKPQIRQFLVQRRLQMKRRTIRRIKELRVRSKAEARRQHYFGPRWLPATPPRKLIWHACI